METAASEIVERFWERVAFGANICVRAMGVWQGVAMDSLKYR
jgi:hypothetical protein